MASSTFEIDIISPRLIHLPSILDDSVPVAFTAATMRIRHDGQVVAEWDEDDVEAALRDLSEKVTFNLGDDLHVDLFPDNDERVHISVTSAHTGEPTTVTTTEPDYFSAIDETRAHLENWQATNPAASHPAM